MSERANARGYAGKFGRNTVIAAACFLLAALDVRGQTLQEVTGFGSNPGNLRMFAHLPEALPANAPLIVALHGCRQSASAYDEETGWVEIAGRSKSALLLPQQQPVNNPTMCFNWFLPGDSGRGEGEALSIKQMIDRMKEEHALDSSRVFVTGLSAGGAMTSVMLAAYPEVFAGGAVVAGVPYRCATSLFEAFGCMNPGRDLTPASWGALVRSAFSHPGPWPRVSIWQGAEDQTVAPMNAGELIDQWTDVHGIDNDPDGQDSVNGHQHKVYKDGHGEVQVESYTIAGMGHGTPVWPGAGGEHCGNPGEWILDAGICSSYHIARFWGLEAGPPKNPHPLRDQMLQRIEKMKANLNTLEAKVRQINM